MLLAPFDPRDVVTYPYDRKSPICQVFLLASIADPEGWHFDPECFIT
jgi:hypothetical protein